MFVGSNEPGRHRRLFGGQVAGQALAAAARTVEGRPAHSLHAYFLRGGDPELPVRYEVDRIRDGSSFTTRRVVAMQGERAIFNLSASFHAPEPSYEHQAPLPAVVGPEGLPTWEERARDVELQIPEPARGWLTNETPIEIRTEHAPSWFARQPTAGPNTVWLKARGELPDDPLLHQCLFAYASDMGFVDNLFRPHAGGKRDVMIASLDHALWLHRPFRMDDWLVSIQESPAAYGARGFAQAAVYTADGTRVASVVQEGLLRRIGQEALWDREMGGPRPE